MADEKKQTEARELSRRKLLERVALGGAAISMTSLPSQWVKPVVETDRGAWRTRRCPDASRVRPVPSPSFTPGLFADALALGV